MTIAYQHPYEEDKRRREEQQACKAVPLKLILLDALLEIREQADDLLAQL